MMGQFEGRHSLKLMYIRKAHEKEDPPADLYKDEPKDDFPRFINGKGKGFENKDFLRFDRKDQEDEWEEEDQDAAEDNDVEELDDDEDLLEIFISNNTKTAKGSKLQCLYCKETLVSESGEHYLPKRQMTEHFIEKHKSEFDEFFGGEEDWEEVVKRSQNKPKSKNKSKKGKKPNMMDPFAMFGGDPSMGMGMGGMPFMFDMKNMGNMFNMSEEETEMMMNDFEKMMGGMGFGGMPGMEGMGFGRPEGGNKKKKGKK